MIKKYPGPGGSVDANPWRRDKVASLVQFALEWHTLPARHIYEWWWTSEQLCQLPIHRLFFNLQHATNRLKLRAQLRSMTRTGDFVCGFKLRVVVVTATIYFDLAYWRRAAFTSLLLQTFVPRLVSIFNNHLIIKLVIAGLWIDTTSLEEIASWLFKSNYLIVMKKYIWLKEMD